MRTEKYRWERHNWYGFGFSKNDWGHFERAGETSARKDDSMAGEKRVVFENRETLVWQVDTLDWLRI